MIWYKRPEYRFQQLTDSILVLYNDIMIASVTYDQQAQIRDIFVAPEHRRQGLGSYLLLLVERRLGRQAWPMPPVSDLGRLLFK